MKKYLAIFVLMFPLIASAQTASSTADLQILIKQLQAQIQSLQAQIADLQTQVQSVKTELKFGRVLTQGAAGDDVKQLQGFLKTFPNVYPEGLVTGYFGPLTEAAVKRFQEQNGIESVGVVGPKTQAKLNELVSTGTGQSSIVPLGLLNAPEVQTKIATTTGGFVSPVAVAVSAASTTQSGTTSAVPATPAQPIGQTGATTVPATPATPAIPNGGTPTPPPTPTPTPTLPPPLAPTPTPPPTSSTTFIITASAGAGGTISPSGQVSVNAGGNQTFTIAANQGYQNLNKFVDGNSVGGQIGITDSYTFASVNANHTITANFFRGNDATLGDLTVNGTRIAGFSGNTYSYTVQLPAGTTAIPTVSVRTNDPYATAVVTQATALPGSATVLVIAQDGITQQTDTVNFTVAPVSIAGNNLSTTLILQDIGSLPAVPEVPSVNARPGTAYTFTLSLTNSILLGGDPSRKVSIVSFAARLPSPFSVSSPVVCPSGWKNVNLPNNGFDVGKINCDESDANNRQYDITYGQTGSVSFAVVTPSSAGTYDLSLPVSYIKNDGSTATTNWSPAVHIIVGQ